MLSPGHPEKQSPCLHKTVTQRPLLWVCPLLGLWDRLQKSVLHNYGGINYLIRADNSSGRVTSSHLSGSEPPIRHQTLWTWKGWADAKPASWRSRPYPCSASKTPPIHHSQHRRQQPGLLSASEHLREEILCAYIKEAYFRHWKTSVFLISGLPTGTVSSMSFVGNDDPLLWLCLPLSSSWCSWQFPAVLFSDICSLGISRTWVTHGGLAPSELGSSPDPIWLLTGRF